ncbi:PucR family transcriptional regulator [Amycolatopsis sp. NPDC049868]|uniref:PucR family transcriptional regulator n=1 Tax=Amycolatopsis sp. NPDC049868 TaxID=3363934 RepID=UPI003799BA5D
MSIDPPLVHRPLRVGGIAVHERLLSLETQLVKQMAGHIDQEIAAIRAMSPERVVEPIRRLVGLNLDHAARMLRDRVPPNSGDISGISDVVERAVQDGLTLTTVLRGCQVGLRGGWELLVQDALPDDVDDVVEATKLLMQLQETVTTAACTAYVEALNRGAKDDRATRRMLLTALLNGEPHDELAEHYGIPVAAHYDILRLAFGRGTGDDTTTLRALHEAMGSLTDELPLAALYPDRGVVLLARSEQRPRSRVDLDDLVTSLAVTTGIRITAATAAGSAQSVPEADEQAGEVLDVVVALGLPPGLYTVADIPLELQVAKPGPAGEALAMMLDPLAEFPFLFETLETYLRHDANRRKTATAHGVHANTIDYRLRRIAELTGLDPARPAHFQRLSAAYTARRIYEARRNADRPSTGRLCL